MKKMDNTPAGSWTLDSNPISSAVKNSCHPNLKVLCSVDKPAKLFDLQTIHVKSCKTDSEYMRL